MAVVAKCWFIVVERWVLEVVAAILASFDVAESGLSSFSNSLSGRSGLSCAKAGFHPMEIGVFYFPPLSMSSRSAL